MYYFKTYFWNIWKIWRLIENLLSESFNSQSKYFNFWARRNVNWKYWFGFYHHQTSLHHLKSNFYFRNSHWCDHMKGSVRRQAFDHYFPVFYICDGQQDWIHAKLTYERANALNPCSHIPQWDERSQVMNGRIKRNSVWSKK